jgi:hypothetical protein
MFMVGMAGSPRVLPFQDSPIWQELAKYAISLHPTLLRKRYNKARWDARGPGVPLHPAKFSRHPIDSTGCNNPVGGFSGFGIRFAGTRETH